MTAPKKFNMLAENRIDGFVDDSNFQTLILMLNKFLKGRMYGYWRSQPDVGDPIYCGNFVCKEVVVDATAEVNALPIEITNTDGSFVSIRIDPSVPYWVSFREAQVVIGAKIFGDPMSHTLQIV